MKSIAIIGAGGHGKAVADIASECGFTLIEFYDDRIPSGQTIGEWKVKGNVEELEQLQDCYQGIIVAIGQNQIRSTLMRKFPLTKLVTLIHPLSIVSAFAQIGAGTVIMPGAVVNAFSRIGSGVIINTAAIIEHDCCIEDFSHVSPGAVLSGNVHVGKYSWLGANCSIKQNVSIGANAMVGMGAVVVKDVQPSMTVIGAPARELLK